jgi:hypothetical protein
MTELQVSPVEMDGIAEAIAGLTAPEAPKELLSAVAAAITTAMGLDAQPVTVTVTIGPDLPLPEQPYPPLSAQFDSAYTPDVGDVPASDSSSPGVTVTVNKVGR